jgi:putative flavoprotein involved in K+ transport
VSDPILQLDLAEAGVTAIIWATGFALDFAWVKAGTFDERGAPRHQRGVAEVPGLYLLGLSWLSRRASSFIFGAEHDAIRLADHILSRRNIS